MRVRVHVRRQVDGWERIGRLHLFDLATPESVIPAQYSPVEAAEARDAAVSIFRLGALCYVVLCCVVLCCVVLCFIVLYCVVVWYVVVGCCVTMCGSTSPTKDLVQCLQLPMSMTVPRSIVWCHVA